MTVEEKSGNEKLTLYVSGRVDAATAPELDKFISDRIDGLEELVLDFKGVEYISSAGLRVLLGTYKTMEGKKGELIIRSVNREVEDILYITGFLEFLHVEDESGKRVTRRRE